MCGGRRRWRSDLLTRPARKADCRISADPVAFLLTGAERESQWKALLTERMLAYGRKPWLALRFKKIYVKA